ncbi:MAG: tetratricopeptide repeat protein [Candidatus Krumholzibacteriia bacterium]
MVRSLRYLLVCATVGSAALVAGCSVRHHSFLSETDLAAASVDSVSLDDFLALAPADRALRAERAEAALKPLAEIESAQAALDRLLSAPLVHTPSPQYRNLPALGDVIEHLDASIGLDPSRADLWLVRGRLLDLAGDRRRARQSLAMAWEVQTRVPEQRRDAGVLRRDIAVTAAWIERDAGWWDPGLAWLDRAADDFGTDDSEAILLRGLLLAGRGDLEEAMRLSYRLPPVELPVVSDLGLTGFLGLKRQKSDMLKRWLQAEVWMRRGEPDLAWNVLGEIPYWRRITVIPHRLYQDIGLYYELGGLPDRANFFYALAYVRREYRRSTMPVPLACDPVIRGLPDARLNFYRLDSGAFHGGSLTAFAASTTMLALVRGEGGASDQSYLLATEALETCLRRGIHPAEALALRGRLRFSRGHYVLAEMDLAEARARFAGQNEIEPWTSYLLGLIAMGRDRAEEATGFLEESLAVDDRRAGAWDALGVARLQLGKRAEARAAFDRAVELDPQLATAWFNRGLLRSQEGDLAAGVADFEQAAQLAPDNPEIGRIIQLARLAQREGRSFLPGLGPGGRWQPAEVEVMAHEGSRFAPAAVGGREAWRGRLGELIDDIMAETGQQARADGLDAAALRTLSAAYDADPTPRRRKLLAHALVWLDLPEAARDLLAPFWGRDLDNDEVFLLLWLDQRAGEQSRLRELAAAMGKTLDLEVGRFDWQGLLSLLNERDDPVYTGPTTFARYDVEQMSTSYGALWNVWLNRQADAILLGYGDRDGNLLVDPRGRSYSFPRGGEGRHRANASAQSLGK